VIIDLYSHTHSLEGDTMLKLHRMCLLSVCHSAVATVGGAMRKKSTKEQNEFSASVPAYRQRYKGQQPNLTEKSS